jgi:hypothetical protein
MCAWLWALWPFSVTSTVFTVPFLRLAVSRLARALSCGSRNLGIMDALILVCHSQTQDTETFIKLLTFQRSLMARCSARTGARTEQALPLATGALGIEPSQVSPETRLVVSRSVCLERCR